MKKLFIIIISLLSLQTYAQKPQVWDFGAQPLNPDTYENMLTEQEINSWYGLEVVADSTGVTLPTFTASEGVNLHYNTAGASNHRLRTTNTKLICYDRKSLKDANGNIYTGYIYSNSGSKPAVYIEQTFEAGDKVEYYVGSNGGQQTYGFLSPSGVEATALYTASAKIECLTFYPGETGKYRLYGIDEKLVVARIVRTPAQKGTLTGTVTAPETIPADYRICFTNNSNQAAYYATPNGNTYTVSGLPMGYEYTLSLEGANGYVISSESSILFSTDGQQEDIAIVAVDLCTVSGTIKGLPAEQWERLSFEFEKPESAVFVPQLTKNVEGEELHYSLIVEKNIAYHIVAIGVNDYILTNSDINMADEQTDYVLQFEQKQRHTVTIQPTYLTTDELQTAVFTFTNLHEDGYVYMFTGITDILLRDGTYSVQVSQLPAGASQMLTSNLHVAGADITKRIDFESTAAPEPVPYKATITVGTDKEYTTINAALSAIRLMQRTAGQRVTILVEPGNYEEMLRIDMDNITMKNASDNASISLLNAGVDIAPEAVRITSYYGHGYNYYSMNTRYQYDERTLQVNKENGYESTVNAGGTASTYWNATVIVTGDNFVAEDIIFENSFNQYISKKESGDVVVEAAGSKGLRPTEAGNIAVQARPYRERACALAFAKGADKAYLDNCRIVGRQDALYGDNNCRVAVQGGVLMGACDYIFGGMTLVCNETELALLLTADNNDVAYITASKTAANMRGYLFYNCTVTSAVPEQDMVETTTAKAGYFGRPWDANAETVFFNTRIGTTPANGSLILSAGWNNGLVASGSNRSYEYGTQETAVGVDNSSKRVEWATVLTEPILPDGTPITLYNFTKGTDGWNPFDADTYLPQTDSPLGVSVSVCNSSLLLDNITAPTEVYVYAIDGRTVAATSVVASASIPLSAGIYILLLRQGEQMQTKKIRL